jgi:uncharacterized protein (TIGR02147 family)
MELAKRALDRVPRQERELSTLTMGISEETYAKVKDEIRKCRGRVQELARRQQKAERVYQANFQVFPLSRAKPK